MFRYHPFAMEAWFDYSLTLTFAVPKSVLESLIPPCLALDTFNNEWAFIAVAFVRTRALRPKGMPAFLGRDFFLAGYRIFVRYTDKRGRRYRGLYILKSETESRGMEIVGNLFTHYNFSTTEINVSVVKGITTIESLSSGFKIVYSDTDVTEKPLPLFSPFASLKEARRFSGPLPFTFSYIPSSKQVIIVEGVRENWTPQPVMIHYFNISFMKNLGLEKAQLANAFIVKNIPYWWKKGRVEIWNP